MTNALHFFSLTAERFWIGLLLNHLAEVLAVGAVLTTVRVVIKETGCFMRLRSVIKGQERGCPLRTSASDWLPKPRQVRQAFIRNVVV